MGFVHFPSSSVMLYGVLVFLATIFTIMDSSSGFVGIQVTDFLTKNRFRDVSLSSGSRAVVHARSLVECCALCAISSYCKSVHFCSHSDQCSLNDLTVCDTGYSGLVPHPGCTYYDTLNHPEDQVFSSICSPSPCNHGGTCSHVCPQAQATCSCIHPYYGDSCQNRDGVWGTWGIFSACNSACQRTRWRTCNYRTGAGLPCSGSSTETTVCPASESNENCGEGD